MWNEDLKYYRNGNNSDEENSIDHCYNSIYKYKVFYHVGQYYEFDDMKLTIDYEAVSSIYINFIS